MKRIGLAVIIIGSVFCGATAAFSQTCLTDPRCPCIDWNEIKANLEWTMNTPEPRACIEGRMRTRLENGYEAFRNCNYDLRSKNGVTGRDTGKMYKSCAAYVCNWLPAQNPPWTPAC